MKLVRYQGDDGAAKLAVCLDNGHHADISFFGEDIGEHFFATNGMERLAQWIAEHADWLEPLDGPLNFLPPFQRPSKIICAGLNYADHAKEVNAKPPTEPILFYKSTSALASCIDAVLLPPASTQLDYEVELAVVIGKKARRISEKEANEHIAGYTLCNDYSERDYQLNRKGQWLKGKSYDSFAPFGPCLATPDELPDPHNLAIWLEVNGEMRQQSNTNQMIFSIPSLVSYISQFMTLLPGDVICTGTPAGVGMGFQPPKFLQAGDRIRYGIEGLGEATQMVVQDS